MLPQSSYPPFTTYPSFTTSPSHTMNPSDPSSSRPSTRQQAGAHPYHPRILSTIITTLEVAEKALDGVSVTGAKAVVGSILLILKRVDVWLSPMSKKCWLTMCYQTSKKNKKKLETLKEHIDQLCTGVLTPMCKADKDLELPQELKDSIDIFIAYA